MIILVFYDGLLFSHKHFSNIIGVHGNGQQDENAYETCRRSNRKKCITIEKKKILM